MIENIGQIAITVKEIDGAVEFYRDILKIELLFTAPPKLAFFNVDGIRLMLSEPEEPNEVIRNSTVYFNVNDIDEAYSRLCINKEIIVDEPHVIAKFGNKDLWMFFIKDNSGNLIGLMQEK